MSAYRDLLTRASNLERYPFESATMADSLIWRDCIDAANAYSRGDEDGYFAELTKGYGILSPDVPGLPNPTLHP